jgi:hypothetical protein
MADRRYDRNVGYLELPLIPDDKFIAGAIVILSDEEGELSTQFVAESLDMVPDVKQQEEITATVTEAWREANLHPVSWDWGRHAD